MHARVLSAVRYSIRRKLMFVVLATTAVALLLTGTSMMLHDLRTYHETWINDLFVQANLIGSASAPALQFDAAEHRSCHRRDRRARELDATLPPSGHDE